MTTQKNGVKHKEVMLPKDAPEEYKDREPYWSQPAPKIPTPNSPPHPNYLSP